MSHKCKCECKHKNVRYCKKCDKVHCLDCAKEWPDTNHYPYYPYYPYSWYYTSAGTSDWTYCPSTTTTGSINIAREQMQDGTSYLTHSEVFDCNH